LKLLARNSRYWLPVLFWLGVIVYESFRLSSNVTGSWLLHLFRLLHIQLSWSAFSALHHFLRKAGHVTGYGIFCLLLFRAWFHSLRPDPLASPQHDRGRVAGQELRMMHVRCALLAISMTLLTAFFDEWHQGFDRARTSSPWDVVLDVSGGVIFLAFALLVLRLWRERPRQWDTASA
jgi:VanZ family protein